MNKAASVVAAAGLGAGLMYFFDPVQGRRRQALLRDQFVHGARRLRMGLEKGGRDLCHRAEGWAHEFRHILSDGSAPDVVVAERVRSKIGRYSSHPRAIRVDVSDGNVILSGPILAHEVESLVEAVRGVRGVRSVNPRFEVHAQAGDIPALQGGRASVGESWDFAQQEWSPATRLLVGLGGGFLMAYGLTQRFPTSCALGTAGLAMCAAAMSSAGNPVNQSLALGDAFRTPSRETSGDFAIMGPH